MKNAIFLATVVCTLLSPTVFVAQDGTPEPTPISQADVLARQKDIITAQKELLEAQRLYLEVFVTAAKSANSQFDASNSGGKTNFAQNALTIAPPETADLEFEAVREIAKIIHDKITGKVSNLGNRRIVLFYKDDFNALSRYRFFRAQTDQALRNYCVFLRSLGKDDFDGGSRTRFNPAFTRECERRGIRLKDPFNPVTKLNDPDTPANSLITALVAPRIATEAVRSAAELASLFRTESTLTQAAQVANIGTLNADIAGTFVADNVPIYNPLQFVPDYDIGTDDSESFYSRLASVSLASAHINAFLAENNSSRSEQLKQQIAVAKMIQAQLGGLQFTAISDPVSPGVNAADDDKTAAYSEFRKMLRAEKLDRFLRCDPKRGSKPVCESNEDNKALILYTNLIKSGGTVRERSNLILGHKYDYSGSAFVEFALYDVNGTMLMSEVFRHHTGFRKFPTQKDPSR